jgi:hypothetical protein
VNESTERHSVIPARGKVCYVDMLRKSLEKKLQIRSSTAAGVQLND